MKFKYSCCCVGLCLFSVVCIHAAEKKPLENSSAVELCAYYVDENDFELHSLNGLKFLPDSDWVYPDSIVCEKGQSCSPFWETGFKLVLPNKDTARGGYGIRAISADREKVIRPGPIGEIELPPWKLCTNGRIPNAQEYFKRHYGKKLKGITTTGLEGNHEIYLNHEFDVKLVGECGPLVVDEYCISTKTGFKLLNNKNLDCFPEILFAKNGINMNCGKGYKVIKRLELDFGDYGKKTMGPYTESSVCSNIGLWEDIRVPLFEIIDLSDLASMHQKDLNPLYGKTIPVRWDAELQCGSNTIEKSGEYLIRIKGKCSEEEENLEYHKFSISSFSQAMPASYENNSCVVFSEEK